MKALILFLAQLGLLQSLEAKECFSEFKVFEEKDFFVKTRFYEAPQSLKTILIIPPTGGTNMIDRSYARFLCAHGFNVHILDEWTMFDELNFDLDIHRRFYGRVQNAIDIILSKTPLTHETSILGTSVGALHAAIATGRSERISKALFITGGADIAGIIVDSDQELMKTARIKRSEMFGFKTRDEYYMELKKHIVLDPLNYPDSFSKKKITLVTALKDTTVPLFYQNKLKDLTRAQKNLELNDNHFWAIMKTWLFYKDYVLAAFR